MPYVPNPLGIPVLVIVTVLIVIGTIAVVWDEFSEQEHPSEQSREQPQ